MFSALPCHLDPSLVRRGGRGLEIFILDQKISHYDMCYLL